MDTQSMKPHCVLGILDTPKGNAIAERMLDWLLPVYEVEQVRHDGTQFEYPAIKAARDWSVLNDEPVLYIHTRGAVNTYPTTQPTHRMWQEQFGKQWRKYFTLTQTNSPLVLAPFVDKDRETRYNGFVANASAWRLLDIQPSTDRFVYERLWAGHDECPVIGLLVHSQENNIKRIRQYLQRNYGN